ncbi:YceI family protein [Aestuariibius insulae]|uniref:YceI family protein n=1 Tax=Aestuariibius insulae TaxID=2058287 RepID=UPI00345EE1B8
MRYLITLLLFLTTAVQADPERYALDPARSEVGFTYIFSGDPVQGTMPVLEATLLIDLERIERSEVSVTLDPARADGGFAFAGQALRSASVLDVAAHPTIRFRSTAISGDLNGATLRGLLTVRGVTQEVELRGQLLRQAGTAATERDRLAIRLTGAIDRRAFGATGYPGFVGPRIDLRILAQINRVE